MDVIHAIVAIWLWLMTSGRDLLFGLIGAYCLVAIGYVLLDQLADSTDRRRGAFLGAAEPPNGNERNQQLREFNIRMWQRLMQAYLVILATGVIFATIGLSSSSRWSADNIMAAVVLIVVGPWVLIGPEFAWFYLYHRQKLLRTGRGV